LATPRRRGRPRRVNDACATERISAWITPHERAALRQMAAAQDASIGAVIREAVNAYVADAADDAIFTSVQLPSRLIQSLPVS
jgi:hypothetical protein